MKVYHGYRSVSGAFAYVTEYDEARGAEISRELNPRFDLVNHSPDGFEWGYQGSAPAQLALAILADALNDDDRALNLHQYFKMTFIGNLNREDPWCISESFVKTIANETERILRRLHSQS